MLSQVSIQLSQQGQKQNKQKKKWVDEKRIKTSSEQERVIYRAGVRARKTMTNSGGQNMREGKGKEHEILGYKKRGKAEDGQ